MWFNANDSLNYAPLGNLQFGYTYPFMSGFFLDGAQRVWTLRNSQAGSVAPYFSIKEWTRFPVEPPYDSSTLSVDLGLACLHTHPFPTTWYWQTYWGNASLFEFVKYTDPYGDLDGDGVSNRTELANFQNPLLPYGFSPVPTATATGGAPGTTMTVNYTVPGDQGFAYIAPFSLVPQTENLGGGLFIPVLLNDPLVQLSFIPGGGGMTGITGVLDSQGAATATIPIPPEPWLTGVQIGSCIVTRDPNLPMILKTVSRPFTFTIP
jgi:hypothetical protein